MWLTGAVALVLPWVARWALSEPLLEPELLHAAPTRDDR